MTQDYLREQVLAKTLNQSLILQSQEDEGHKSTRKPKKTVDKAEEADQKLEEFLPNTSTG